MIIKKTLLWGLPILLIVILRVFFLIDKEGQAGWTTYLPNGDDCHTSGINNILIDKQGFFWADRWNDCVNKYELYAFDGNSWTNTKMESSINSIHTDNWIKIDSQGQPWILDIHGEPGKTYTTAIEIKKYVNGNWSTITITDMQTIQKGDARVESWGVDKQGRLWIGFINETEHWLGISVFDGQRWTTYKRAGAGIELGKFEEISELAFDSQERVWIVTDSGNVSIFDGHSWTHNANPLRYNPTAIAFDGHDRVWIAEGGVYIFDGEKWMYISPNDLGIPECHDIITIAFDENGNAWLRTSSGEIIWYDNGWKVKKVGSGQRNDACNFQRNDADNFPIVFDHQGRVWTSDYSSVSVFNGKTWKTFTSENSGLLVDKISDLDVDKKGFIWISTNHGTSVVNPNDIANTPAGLLALGKFIARGGYWLLPFILVSFWFAFLLDMERGAKLVILLVILSSVSLITIMNVNTHFQSWESKNTRFFVYSVGFAGVAGELLGGIIDKLRGKGNLAIILAILGAIVGFVYYLVGSFGR